MTISDGDKTKKLTMYSPAQLQLDLDQVSWPKLGDDSFEVNFFHQLMMMERNPFFVSQEEDDILIAIVTNQYDFEESSCENPTCSLQTVLPICNTRQFLVAYD